MKFAYGFAKVKPKTTDFKDKLKVISQIRQYFIPFMHKNPEVNRSLFKSYGYLILSKFCFFGGPLFLKHGINTLSGASLMHPLMMFFGYGVCYSASVLFQSMRNIQTFKITAIALQQTTQKAYRHMLLLDPEFFFSGPQRHRLFSLFKAQRAMQQNIKAFTQYFIPIFVDIIMSVALLLYYSNSLFVLSFLTCYGAYSVFTIKYSEFRKKQIRLQRQSEKNLDFITSETFANYYNVKYFGVEQKQIDKYKKAIYEYYQTTLQTQKSLAILNTTQRAIFGTGLTFNMILAAYYAKIGILSAGDIIMIQTLMLQFLTPLFFLGSMYRSFTDTFIDVKQLRNIMQREPKVKPGNIQLTNCHGNIKFQNVKFKYEQDSSYVFKNINLEFKQNQFVALVGPSGIGKSTLLHLIFRLYDASNGQVTIDGHNVKDLNFSFRNHITFVSQMPYLFNGTVMENLKFGNESIPDQQVIKLTKELDIHDIIMQLPKQYNSNVGEKGNIFSGGQKQRLSLIRSLLKNCKIMLLDEPTSSLDSQTQLKVANVIKRYKNCTRIMITHRQALSHLADRIIHIDQADIPQPLNKLN